nr:hypothetical protein [Tanacetum cinerariifolium]
MLSTWSGYGYTLYPDIDVIKIGLSSLELECSSTSELKCSSTSKFECSSTSESELSSYVSSYEESSSSDESLCLEKSVPSLTKMIMNKMRIDEEAEDGKDDSNDELWSPKTIEPLVDDLHTLFETGVDTYDASTKDNFNLHVVVLWIINDYPALGTLCGCPYNGFNGCVVCGKDTNCVRLSVHKEIILQELDKMQAELVVTLCLLKKFFPSSFFDIMVHLTVHLTREVKLCGPICFWWMYPFERCMKVIKGHVGNKNRPEGCIVETITEETIEFFSEYHKSMKTIGIPPGKHKTDENKEGKQLSIEKSSELSTELFQKAHLYVIQTIDEILSYIERHKQLLKTENPGKQIAFLENEHSKSFTKWLHKEVERELAIFKESVSETVRWISYRPRATVVKYDAYNTNGYTFRTKCHDGKVYQTSRVSVEAIDLHISKEVTTIRQAF